MPLRPEPKFPNRLSYVLKLRGDATPDALVGRLVNLVTDQRLDFGSGRQLLDALARELDANSSDAAPE